MGGHRSNDRGHVWGKALVFLPKPLALFYFAVVLVWCSGRWRHLIPQLIDLSGLVVGIVAGIVLFLISWVFLNRRFGSLAKSVRRAACGSGWRVPPVNDVIRLAVRSVYEEMLWRGTVQPLLGGGWVGIAGTALLFTLLHAYFRWVNRQPAPPRVFFEFLGFSLVLGGAYEFTDRLMVVVGLHWARNLLVAALARLGGFEGVEERKCLQINALIF